MDTNHAALHPLPPRHRTRCRVTLATGGMRGPLGALHAREGPKGFNWGRKDGAIPAGGGAQRRPPNRAVRTPRPPRVWTRPSLVLKSPILCAPGRSSSRTLEIHFGGLFLLTDNIVREATESNKVTGPCEPFLYNKDNLSNMTRKIYVYYILSVLPCPNCTLSYPFLCPSKSLSTTPSTNSPPSHRTAAK